MTNRRESRTRAYHYIIKQDKQVNQNLSREPEKTLSDADYISLNNLMRLKDGLAALSPELVVALKRLLGQVTSETRGVDRGFRLGYN